MFRGFSQNIDPFYFSQNVGPILEKNGPPPVIDTLRKHDAEEMRIKIVLCPYSEHIHSNIPLDSLGL